VKLKKCIKLINSARAHTHKYTDKHKNRLIANVGVRNVNPVHKKWTQPQQKEAKKMNV
jgi:hypothetical protein